MTLRTSVSAAEETRMLDGTGRWMFKVEVRRRTSLAWTNLSEVAGGDWVLAMDADIPTPDVAVRSFVVRFVRAADGHSLSPGIAASSLNVNEAFSFSPLVYPGRLIRVYAYCAEVGESRLDADWHLWLEGEILRASFDDDVVATCVNQDGSIQEAQIEAAERRGAAEPGVPMPVEFQGLLDRWKGLGVVTLHTEGDPDFGLGFYDTEPGSLGEFLLSQARRAAWDLRYRWNDAAGAFLYTLYLPPRDKTVPDLTLSAQHILQVPGLDVDKTSVRNAFTHTYRDSATRRIVRNTTENATSIGEFGRVWMGVTEDEGSPLDSAAKSDNFLAFAKNDLGQPPTEKRARLPFLPFLDLHHMIRVPADGARFDFAQDYSVVGGRHVVSIDELSTTADLRGGTPVGMYYAWERRRRGNVTPHDWLIELVEPVEALETETTYTYRVTGGGDVAEIWWDYQIFAGEATEERRQAVAAVAEAGKVLTTLPEGLAVLTKPTATQVGILYLSPKILQAGQIISPPVQESARYVDVFGPQLIGPSLDVFAAGGLTQYTITWAGDAVELSTDGGVTFNAPPASPFTVNRPAVGAAPLLYSFRGTKDGIAATNVVPIQPLGVTLVPVNLSAVPVAGSTNNLQAAFTATAVRLDTSASVPVKVTLRGCSGTNNGVALPDGVQQTVNGTVIAFRPAFGQPMGIADFVAEISGTVYEQIGREIQPVQRDTIGPSLNVTPGTPTATTIPISWVATAGTDVIITATSGLAIVFNVGSATTNIGTLTVTRPAAGSPVGLVKFYSIRDGIENTQQVSIPPIGADTVTPNISVTHPGGDNNDYAYFQASASNPRTGAAVPVVITFVNCTASVAGVGIASGTTLDTAWVVRVDRPVFGAATGSVTFSATVTSAGEVYGGTARISKDVPPKQQDTTWPLFEVERTESAGVGTAWVKFVERGILVSSVEAQTQVGEQLVSGWTAPTRGPGAASVVNGGVLGALEYEQDVPTTARDLSQINLRVNLTGQSTPLTVPTVFFDRTKQPRLARVTLSGQTLDIQGNDDVRSIKVYRTDVAGWTTSVDGFSAIITVPVPSGANWPVRVLAYAASIVDITGSTLYDERDVIVSGTGAPAEPTWSFAGVDAPAVGDSDVSISLHATSAPVGYTMRVSARLNGGAYTDITTDIGGPTPVPTSLTVYAWDTLWTRTTPPGMSLTVDILAELLNASSVVVATSDTLPVRPTCTYTVT